MVIPIEKKKPKDLLTIDKRKRNASLLAFKSIQNLGGKKILAGSPAPSSGSKFSLPSVFSVKRGNKLADKMINLDELPAL